MNYSNFLPYLTPWTQTINMLSFFQITPNLSTYPRANGWQSLPQQLLVHLILYILYFWDQNSCPYVFTEVKKCRRRGWKQWKDIVTTWGQMLIQTRTIQKHTQGQRDPSAHRPKWVTGVDLRGMAASLWGGGKRKGGKRTQTPIICRAQACLKKWQLTLLRNPPNNWVDILHKTAL